MSSSHALSHSSLLKRATVDLARFYRSCNPAFSFVHALPKRCLTNPSDPVHNNDWDNQHHDYILYVNDTLQDTEHTQYFTVLDLLGTGTFGQVVKCRQNDTGNIVAVKVIKNQPAYFQQAWLEINILRMLHLNNPPEDTRHIVKLHAHFEFRGHLCLVFERLSINLYELLKQNSYVGIGLDLLRNFLSQILHALDVLVRSEIIHCDLKPENILVKALDTTELKIIDFGSACQLHYPIYSYVQSRFYRSPEVLLGWTRYDSKIDMWSLGCVAAELFLGIPLFPGQNEMNMVARIVEMLGDPPDRFLDHCRYTSKFFNGPVTTLNHHPHHLHHSRHSRHHSMRLYQLKPIEQYEQENSVSLPEWKRFFTQRNLRDIIMKYPTRSPTPPAEEFSLRESFIDLLNGMLKVDPHERWTPAEAKEHPFLSGKPLSNGQPWVPPTRSRRFTRSRPVHIAAPNRPDASNIDSMISSSAPNFPRSRLAQHPNPWPIVRNPADPTLAVGQVQNGHYSRTFAPHIPSGAFSYATQPEVTPIASMPPMFAPGSYVPPSAIPPFNPLQMSSMHRVQQRIPPVLPPLTSFDGRPLYFTSPADPHSQPGEVGAPAGEPSTPIAYGLPATPMRSTAGLHGSASRESLTSSLHMSASRESLGFVRDPSVTDLCEDGVFQFAPDDDVVVSGLPGTPLSSVQPPAPGPPPLSMIPTMANHGVPFSSNPLSPGGRLPPSARRPNTGRTTTMFGTAPMVSQYGYTLGLHQRARPIRTSSATKEALLGPFSTDVVMTDVDFVDNAAGRPATSNRGDTVEGTRDEANSTGDNARLQGWHPPAPGHGT